jgi:hypothetical protein
MASVTKPFISDFNAKAAHGDWLLTRFHNPEPGTNKAYTQYHVDHIRRENAEALVLNNGKETVVVFLGSDGYKDFTDGQDNGLIQTAYGVIHKGMARYESYLHDAIMEKATDYGVPIRVVGFSIGGGAAQIFASKLLLHNEQHPDHAIALTGVRTFGQLMVGDEENRAFIEQRHSNYERIYVEEDGFARYPFNRPEFVHAGQPILITDNNAYDASCFAHIGNDVLAEIHDIRNQKRIRDGVAVLNQFNMLDEIAPGIKQALQGIDSSALTDNTVARYTHAIVHTNDHLGYGNILQRISQHNQVQNAQCTVNYDYELTPNRTPILISNNTTDKSIS